MMDHDCESFRQVPRRIVLDIIVPVIAVLLSIGVVCVGLWLGTEVRS